MKKRENNSRTAADQIKAELKQNDYTASEMVTAENEMMTNNSYSCFSKWKKRLSLQPHVHYLWSSISFLSPPISSPPLHYNYYFPHVSPRPQSLVSISFLHGGLRRRWGCWSFPEHTGRQRITAGLKWTSPPRIGFGAPHHHTSAPLQLIFHFFLPIKQTPTGFQLCSLSRLFYSLLISVFAHISIQTTRI